MINELNIADPAVAAELIDVQRPAYMIEARLINFYDIPPLKDTVETVMACGETFYGYYADGALSGAVSFKKENGVLDIHRLVVDPNHFKKGIASALIRFILINNNDVNKAIVSTGSLNTPAVQLYKRLGFVEINKVEIVPGLQITNFEYPY